MSEKDETIRNLNSRLERLVECETLCENSQKEMDSLKREFESKLNNVEKDVLEKHIEVDQLKIMLQGARTQLNDAKAEMNRFNDDIDKYRMEAKQANDEK